MKYCSEQGCKELIQAGRYCSSHKRRVRKKAWHSNNKSFYRTQAWRDLRDFVYERDGGCCNRCGKFVFGREAHAHHVIPIRVNARKKLDADNIVILCNVCHPIVEDETNERHNLKSATKFNWNL